MRAFCWFCPRAAFLTACLLFVPPAFPQSASKPLIFEGARLIDGSGRPAFSNSVLIIEHGVIRAVGRKGLTRYPPGAEIVDLSGKTIIPALINLHGHLGQTIGIKPAKGSYTEWNLHQQLAHYLAYGVGTELSLGTDQNFIIFNLRQAQRTGNWESGLGAARLYTAGRGFGVPGGFPPGGSKGEDRYRPASPQEAQREVQELAVYRPDFVKIWVDDDFGRLPKMKPEIYRAIIDEAHLHHLRVIAHVFYLSDAQALVEAGVDGLGHSVRDKPVDANLINAMKARGVFLIPTLVRDESTFIYGSGPKWLRETFFQAGLDKGELEELQAPAFVKQFRSNHDLPRLEAGFEMAKKNLKTLFDAGVTIGLGTDSGVAWRPQGYFEHRELQLMVEAGLTPMQALVAATGAAAQILGVSAEFGRLQPGELADFLVLDSNPLDDIHNTESLSAVWQAGKPFKPIAAR